MRSQKQRRPAIDSNIVIRDRRIPLRTLFGDFGVILKDDGSFGDHIEELGETMSFLFRATLCHLYAVPLH